MSALGRKRPFEPILAERPLAGVKRTFQIGQFLKMLGLLRKCPLFSEADTQTTEISAKRRAADRGPPINTISMLSSDRLMKIAVGHQRDGQTF